MILKLEKLVDLFFEGVKKMPAEMKLTAVCYGCGGELDIMWKAATTDEESLGIQVKPCEQCCCECALCRSECAQEKELKISS